MSDKTPSAPAVSTEPTVKLTPEFKVGETVTHLGSRTDHKVLAVKPAGLRLQGLAGLINPQILAKK